MGAVVIESSPHTASPLSQPVEVVLLFTIRFEVSFKYPIRFQERHMSEILDKNRNAQIRVMILLIFCRFY